MNDDDGAGSQAFGSLLEVFPHLAAEDEALPLANVHVRALSLELEGEPTLVFVAWRDPGSSAALRRELGERLESALLAFLCRPPSTLARDEVRMPVRLVLVVAERFASCDEAAMREALAPFGLRPTHATEPRHRTLMQYVRGEATRVGLEPPDAPASVWEVSVEGPEAGRAELLQRVEARLVGGLGDAVFGARPGGFAAALAGALEAEGEPPLPEGLPALDRVEVLSSHLRPGVIRFPTPAVFQAFCDLVAVVAAAEFGRRVDWAESEVDDAGLATPPLFRVKLPEGFVHIPIAEFLLRWCVLPLQPGEVPPSVAEWALDQFGDRASVR